VKKCKGASTNTSRGEENGHSSQVGLW